MSTAPMDFETAVERLAQWAVAYAADCEADGIKGIMADVERDYAVVRAEFELSADMDRALSADEAAKVDAAWERHKAAKPVRLDLAIGACQVAVKATELGAAQAFAQTAIDFMTGDYEPLEGDDEYPAPFGNETKGSPP